MASLNKQETQSKRCVPSLKQIERVRNKTRTNDYQRMQLAVLTACQGARSVIFFGLVVSPLF